MVIKLPFARDCDSPIQRESVIPSLNKIAKITALQKLKCLPVNVLSEEFVIEAPETVKAKWVVEKVRGFAHDRKKKGYRMPSLRQMPERPLTARPSNASSCQSSKSTESSTSVPLSIKKDRPWKDDFLLVSSAHRRRVLAARRITVVGDYPPMKKVPAEISAMLERAAVLHDNHEFTQAENLIYETLVVWVTRCKNNREKLSRAHAICYTLVGMVYTSAGDDDLALIAYWQAYDEWEKVMRGDIDQLTAVSQSNIALGLYHKGSIKEAVKMFEWARAS